MPTLAAISRVKMLVLLCLPFIQLLTGCSTHRALVLPVHRPSDFTLGVVVYHDQGWEGTEQRPARYIIEPDATLRASVGDGSTPLTHPPISRRLDQAAFDRIWTLTHQLSMFAPKEAEIEDEPGDNIEDERATRVVHSPETYAPAQGRGYLIEIRSRNDQSAWAMPENDPSAHALVRELAELSWVKP